MKINWSHLYRKFDKSSVKEEVPTEAGVYLLCVQLRNNRWRCFYAGQADNLKAKLRQHLSAREKNEDIKENAANYVCGFWYAKISKQKDRDGIEKFLYDHCSPEGNEVDPGGKPMKINLPRHVFIKPNRPVDQNPPAPLKSSI